MSKQVSITVKSEVENAQSQLTTTNNEKTELAQALREIQILKQEVISLRKRSRSPSSAASGSIPAPGNRIKGKNDVSIFSCEACWATWKATVIAFSFDYECDDEGSVQRALDVLNGGTFEWVYALFDYKGGPKIEKGLMVDELVKTIFTHKDLDNDKRHFLMAAFIVAMCHPDSDSRGVLQYIHDINNGRTNKWADFASAAIGNGSVQQRFTKFFSDGGIFSEWSSLIDMQLLSDTLSNEQIYYEFYDEYEVSEEETIVRKAFADANRALPPPNPKPTVGRFTVYVPQ